MRTLSISKQDGIFVVDDKSRPGSPPVGRGKSMEEAMGEWLRNNQTELGISFHVEESAVPDEAARRARELAER